MTMEKGCSRIKGVCAAYQGGNLPHRLFLPWEEPLSTVPNSENEAQSTPQGSGFQRRRTSTHQGTFAMSSLMEWGAEMQVPVQDNWNFLAPVLVRIEADRPCLRQLNNF